MAQRPLSVQQALDCAPTGALQLLTHLVELGLRALSLPLILLLSDASYQGIVAALIHNLIAQWLWARLLRNYHLGAELGRSEAPSPR
jgi:hypothetical protein